MRGVPLVLLVASLIFCGCSTGKSSVRRPAPAGVQPSVPGPVYLLSTAEVEAMLGEPDVVILHVGHAGQSAESWQHAHIPGARWISWEEVATTRNGIANELPPMEHLWKLVRRAGINTGDRIVLYSEDGGLAAARAFVVLDYLGLGDRAALLDGGLRQWLREKRPVTDAPVRVPPSHWEPKFRPEIVVTLEQVRDASWIRMNSTRPAVALVDSRPADQFTGEVPGPDIARPGRIPGAVNLFWEDHLQSRERPLLRSMEELRNRYRALGLKDGDLVIVYCRTGGQASHGYFVLRMLGYDVRIYDGSFSEWQSRADTPVER